MTLESYDFYTIQNVRSAGAENSKTGFLHVPSAAMTRCNMTQWDYANRFVDFTDHFEFLMIGAEGANGSDVITPSASTGTAYFIVNRRSGLCLMVESFDNGSPLVQAPWPPETDTMAQFVLKAADEGRYRIMSQYNGAYLVADASGAEQGANGLPIKAFNETELPQANDGDLRQMEFIIERVGSAVEGEKLVVDPDLATQRKLPRIKTMSTVLPDATPPRLLEFDRLPFFAVNDPFTPPHRQVDVSPYYTLRRSRMWQKMYDRELDGIVARETTEITTLGLRQVDVRSVRTALTTSVEATASASYSGWGVKAGLSVTAKLQAEAEYSSEHTQELNRERTTEDKITYPSIGRPYRLAKWRPIDRYELYRADDVMVNRWDVVREDEEVIDVFSLPAPRKTKPREAREASV